MCYEKKPKYPKLLAGFMLVVECFVIGLAVGLVVRIIVTVVSNL